MGAWGLGPFDSDAGLDFLGDLAATTSTVDGDYDVVPGSVNYPAVIDGIRAVFTKDAARYGSQIYAAAGLVNSRLYSPQAASLGGTTLFGALAGQDTAAVSLAAHCSYATLLDEDTATALIPDAINAYTNLLNSSWIDGWFDEAITTRITRLRDQIATVR